MRTTFAMICALALSGSVAGAQGRRPHGPPPGAVRAPAPQQRAQLEREFRQRGEELVRQRLNLSNDQMQRLRAVNQRLAPQRRALMLQERDARVALRNEIARGSSADQSRVSALMAQVQQLQQQRLTLSRQEQQELSTFLTPVQQAQYYGLQEQLRARVRAMREGAGQDTSGLP